MVSISYAQGIAAFGTARALAIACGVDFSVVTKWRAAKRIPRDHGLEIVLILAPEAFPELHAETVAQLRHQRGAMFAYLKRARPDVRPRVNETAPLPLFIAPPSDDGEHQA